MNVGQYHRLYGTLDWLVEVFERTYTYAERVLVTRRDEVRLWSLITNDDTGYSFDDLALVQLDDTFYVLSAAGCSCPSHSEAWEIGCKSNDPIELLSAVLEGNYRGWDIPEWAQGALFLGVSIAVATTKGER